MSGLRAYPQASKINWKSEDKNLCSKHPRANLDDVVGEYDGDIGSFFHYFTEAEDILGVSLYSMYRLQETNKEGRSTLTRRTPTRRSRLLCRTR
jgi:hypothetical protein